MSFRNCVVGIVDYRAGNIHSIKSAIEHVGARVLDVEAGSDLARVSHLILPGVGAFGHCADKLAATGLVPSLEQAVLEGGKPLLGICVGMQLLADRGEEMAGHDGLGWLGGVVREMKPSPPLVRIPHVGWNEVRFEEDFGDFAAGAGADFYFDHSYAYHDPKRGRVIGHCEHGDRFAAIVRHGNLVAAQFHPEKSQRAGLRFLAGFLAMEATC
jgi:glutamine amidotransferase